MCFLPQEQDLNCIMWDDVVVVCFGDWVSDSSIGGSGWFIGTQSPFLLPLPSPSQSGCKSKHRMAGVPCSWSPWYTLGFITKAQPPILRRQECQFPSAFLRICWLPAGFLFHIRACPGIPMVLLVVREQLHNDVDYYHRSSSGSLWRIFLRCFQ